MSGISQFGRRIKSSINIYCLLVMIYCRYHCWFKREEYKNRKHRIVWKMLLSKRAYKSIYQWNLQ